MAFIIGGVNPQVERTAPEKVERPEREKEVLSEPTAVEASEEPKESKPAVRKKGKNVKARK